MVFFISIIGYFAVAMQAMATGGSGISTFNNLFSGSNLLKRLTESNIIPGGLPSVFKDYAGTVPNPGDIIGGMGEQAGQYSHQFQQFLKNIGKTIATGSPILP